MGDGKWKARVAVAVVLRWGNFGAGELGICGPQDARSEVELRSNNFVCACHASRTLKSALDFHPAPRPLGSFPTPPDFKSRHLSPKPPLGTTECLTSCLLSMRGAKKDSAIPPV